MKKIKSLLINQGINRSNQKPMIEVKNLHKIRVKLQFQQGVKLQAIESLKVIMSTIKQIKKKMQLKFNNSQIKKT